MEKKAIASIDADAHAYLGNFAVKLSEQGSRNNSIMMFRTRMLTLK